MVGKTVSHYRIWEKIGQGGMGVVYKAEDTILRRFVALKFLVPSAAGDASLRARFFREAQAAGSLNHPNICSVYGVEEYDHGVFIVMAFLDGQPLNRLVGKGLPLNRAIGYALDIGDGLQEAHAHGIVHRDIKSANIIVTSKGRAVITDFGLAMLSDRSRITRTGTTLGTISYMSPEQALGKRLDLRTDIWSLGVVLHEMVAGEYPFSGTNMQTILTSILKDEPRAVHSASAEVPGELRRILNKALAKDPNDRYQHADDLLVDLRAVRRQLRSAASEEEAGPAGGWSGDEAETIVIAEAPPPRQAGSAEPFPSGAVAIGKPASAGWRRAAFVIGAVLLMGLVLFWWRLASHG